MIGLEFAAGLLVGYAIGRLHGRCLWRLRTERDGIVTITGADMLRARNFRFFQGVS